MRSVDDRTKGDFVLREGVNEDLGKDLQLRGYCNQKQSVV